MNALPQIYMPYFKKLLLNIFFTIFVAFPALADDTDIFLGGSQIQPGVQPNVLFILDNSGSMGSSVPGTNQSRLQSMKSAFDVLINAVNNVNVGYMRFNAPGGSVAYPITDIDAELTSNLLESPQMLSVNDDAVEINDTGQVLLNTETLTMAYGNIPAQSNSISIPLAHQDDDAEEYISSGQLTGSSHYQFNMYSSQINGLRFLNMGIPAGATIDSATIQMTASASDSNDTTISIYGESTNNPTIFDHSSSYNVSNRPATTATVNWTITNSWNYNHQYSTPDLSSVLQEMIDHADWSENDAVVFIFEHQSGGHRAGTLYRDDNSSTQGVNGKGAILHVTYSINNGSTGSQTVGLRFQQVAIPQGATITRAQINFTAKETNSDPLNLLVKVENSDNSAEFSNSTNNISDPISRPRYGDTVSWSVDGTWTAEQPEPGPDVTNLVQAIVNRSGWCGNNAMAFFISGNELNQRLSYSYDAGLGREPKLLVEFDASSSTGCINPIVKKAIKVSEDDAHQATNSSRWVDNNVDYLTFRNDRLVGLRFQNMPISQSATIQNAYLELIGYPVGESGYSYDSDDNQGTTNIRIYGHDTDNSAAFPESGYNISNRTKTSANVDWQPENWQPRFTYRSPDIKSVIQEIVNRTNWSPGNGLSLIISNTASNKRIAFSQDGGLAYAPKLIIQIADGGYDASANTARQLINQSVQAMEARTWTPIVDTLYEAARYYRGESVYYGASRELFSPNQGTTPKRYKRVSIEASYTGGTHTLPSGCPHTDSDASACSDEVISGTPVYISPITSDCQSNHIVLLTDGEANNNHDQTKTGINNWTSSWKGRDCRDDSSSSNQECARDLVEWLANIDQATHLPDSSNTIKTHTIAFNLNSSSATSFLSELATLGGGLYKEADTAGSLATAFEQIIQEIISIDSSFVAPGATVNQFNRLTHRNEIYFSLFKPKSSSSWPGNLKRYKLLGSPPVISDVNDNAAVDETTGFFKDTATSIWSDVLDGSQVHLGGAANELPNPPSNRKVYTYLPNLSVPSLKLNNSVNALSESNVEITETMVGAGDSATRNLVLKWARGVDVKDYDGDTDITETRFQIGDPLHSIPKLVTYGGTEESPDITVFVATNEGFLHAFDADNGQEVFSFIPQDLLGNLKTLYDNSSSFDHPYGLDGSPIVWTKDVDFDSQIEPEDGDHVYLYIGMRRGGNQYYALDVTDRSNPKILWVISGGAGDFINLGQTWSTPVKTKVNYNGAIKDVLVFAGGFDTNQDNVSIRTTDTVGNAIYIVDATTGQRLWYASDGVASGDGLDLPKMDYSIPSDVSVIDINRDGLADQLYVGDMGGQLWRFDIFNGQDTSGLVDGNVIADIAGSTNTENRRFFYQPDISLYTDENKIFKLAIALGSGTRFNPLDKIIVDKFYVFYVSDVYDPPENYTTVTETDLYNRSNSTDDIQISGAGWYITLPNQGEKVLANSITLDHNIFFTTYTPDSTANSCQAASGTGRIYAVSLFNGNAVLDLDEDDSVEAVNDRSRQLKSNAIPPAPKVLISEEGKVTLITGPEQPFEEDLLELGRTDRWFNSYWYENKN